MTWLRALLYVAISVVLASYYVAFERDPAGPSEESEGTSRERVQLLAPSVPVDWLQVETANESVSCRRQGTVWEVVEPAGVQVPADLIAAIIGALVDLHAVPVIDSGADPSEEAEFGLKPPLVRLRLGDGSFRLSLQIGSRTPTQTAVYARREGESEVLVLGLNVQYYVDLLLEALRRQTA